MKFNINLNLNRARPYVTACGECDLTIPSLVCINFKLRACIGGIHVFPRNLPLSVHSRLHVNHNQTSQKTAL